MIKITTHTLVRNEDQWIWFALKAWEPYAQEMLVFDDQSDDLTEKVVQSLNSEKITYKKIGPLDSKGMTDARQKMKEQTKTRWFIILDGDEVWSKTTIEKFLVYLEKVDPEVAMVALRTRNCVGDIYHYLDESFGKYEILGKKGHFNIRAYRNESQFRWFGEYPMEYYGNQNGNELVKDPQFVSFFEEGYYWHLTHLPRSSKRSKVKGWRKIKFDLGLQISKNDEFPEVFKLTRPSIVPDPWKRRSLGNTLTSLPLSFLRLIKNRII